MVEHFKDAIESVPTAMLYQITQPLPENTDEFVYSNVFRPIIERCQSSYLPVDKPIYVMMNDESEDDVTSGDA